MTCQRISIESESTLLMHITFLKSFHYDVSKPVVCKEHNSVTTKIADMSTVLKVTDIIMIYCCHKQLKIASPYIYAPKHQTSNDVKINLPASSSIYLLYDVQCANTYKIHINGCPYPITVCTNFQATIEDNLNGRLKAGNTDIKWEGLQFE